MTTKVENARIEHVSITILESEKWQLTMKLTTASDEGVVVNFDVRGDDDFWRVEGIIGFTGQNTIEGMCGKIIRMLIVNHRIYGFGHPIYDQFIPNNIEETGKVSDMLSRAEFEKIIS